jgi:hypothetical protein
MIKMHVCTGASPELWPGFHYSTHSISYKGPGVEAPLTY